MRPKVTILKMMEFDGGKTTISINGKYVRDPVMVSTLQDWIYDAHSR